MPTNEEIAQRHEERSQKSADALRAMLTALATAGIAGAYIVHKDSAGNAWKCAAVMFALALGCVLISWFLAKDRELARRDAAAAKKAPPNFGTFWSSWAWDVASAVLVALGAVTLGVQAFA